jgi:hypothetical protein
MNIGKINSQINSLNLKPEVDRAKFEAKIIDAAKDGNLSKEEFIELKKDLVNGSKDLKLVMSELTSEVNNIFSDGAAGINPSNLKNAENFLKTVLSSDYGIASRTSTNINKDYSLNTSGLVPDKSDTPIILIDKSETSSNQDKNSFSINQVISRLDSDNYDSKPVGKPSINLGIGNNPDDSKMNALSSAGSNKGQFVSSNLNKSDNNISMSQNAVSNHAMTYESFTFKKSDMLQIAGKDGKISEKNCQDLGIPKEFIDVMFDDLAFTPLNSLVKNSSQDYITIIKSQEHEINSKNK